MSGEAQLKLQGRKIFVPGFKGKTVIVRLLPLELCVHVDHVEGGDLSVRVTIKHIDIEGDQHHHRVLYNNTF